MPKMLSNMCNYSSQVPKQVPCQTAKAVRNVNRSTFLRAFRPGSGGRGGSERQRIAVCRAGAAKALPRPLETKVGRGDSSVAAWHETCLIFLHVAQTAKILSASHARLPGGSAGIRRRFSRHCAARGSG